MRNRLKIKFAGINGKRTAKQKKMGNILTFPDIALAVVVADDFGRDHGADGSRDGQEAG